MQGVLGICADGKCLREVSCTMRKKIDLPTPSDLVASSLDWAFETYAKEFSDKPNVLIVGRSDAPLARALVAAYERFNGLEMIVRKSWKDERWMLQGKEGVVFSEGA